MKTPQAPHEGSAATSLSAASRSAKHMRRFAPIRFSAHKGKARATAIYGFCAPGGRMPRHQGRIECFSIECFSGEVEQSRQTRSDFFTSSPKTKALPSKMSSLNVPSKKFCMSIPKTHPAGVVRQLCLFRKHSLPPEKKLCPPFPATDFPHRRNAAGDLFPVPPDASHGRHQTPASGAHRFQKCSFRRSHARERGLCRPQQDQARKVAACSLRDPGIPPAKTFRKNMKQKTMPGYALRSCLRFQADADTGK